MTEEYKRPEPDELLKLIKEEERRKERKKGFLKIFLGYVAGVGKTYRMLSEARLLKEKGYEVAAGLVETHGRIETEELLQDLEVIRRKKIEYSGILLEELDLDEVIKRKPDYVLVDELAHTNIPGLRHVKRYQDVEEILDAGINVYTTMNVQHIESINDIILQITGVEIKETVPDRIIEIADKIEIVDLPVEELIDRLKEGKVYIPEKAKQAMMRFFKEKNLTALREETLRYATVHVDYDMDYYLKKEHITGPWDTSSRIMVCISPNASAKRLIRIAHRFADFFNVQWFAVYVEPSTRFRMKPDELLQLEKNLKLAEELDGEVFRLTGTVADEIESFARLKNITLILMGHSQRSGIREFIEGSVINQVIKKSDAQVLVVENEPKPHIDVESIKKTDLHAKKYDWKPYVVSFLSIGFTAIILWPLQPFIEAVNIPMIFIIPVVFTSLISGRNAGILASLLAVAAFDLFFVPPYFTLSVAELRFIPTFFVLFIVGIITSLLADTVKRQVEYTRQRETFIASLYDLSRDLLTSRDLDDVLEKSTMYISESFNYDALILLPDDKNKLEVVSRFGYNKDYFDDHDISVSNWVFDHNKAAGFGTETLSSSKWYHIPLNLQKRTLGVLAIEPDIDINSEQRHLIESFARVVSLALANYTERKKSEETLKKSEEKYRRLFEDDLTGDFIATPEGKIMESNPAFVEIYGFANREQAAKSDISQFNPTDWKNLIKRLKTEHKITGHQTIHKRPDGKQINVVANVVAIFNKSGQFSEVKGYIFET